MLTDINLETVAYAAYVALAWIARFALVAYVLPRHRPSEAIAWIAITLVHPLIGLPLYMFFGRPVMGRKGIARHERARQIVEREHPFEPLPDRFEGIPAEHRDLAVLTERLGGRPLRAGNRVELIDSATTFAREVVREIEAAQSCVHLLYYIYNDDELTAPVSAALEASARRGIATRLVVDAVGSKAFLRSRAPALREAGVEVVAALPVRGMRGMFARVDVRNHRKLAVFDHRVAITGSHNMTHPSYGQTEYGEWRDVSMRVTGPAAVELDAVFFEDWIAETDEMPPVPEVPEGFGLDEPGDVGVLVSPGGPERRNQSFRDLMVSAINEANEKVVMTTPYFVPDEPSLLALCLRAEAGIDVTVIIPERTNSRLVRLASVPAIRSLLESGATVRLHHRGLLHAKTLSVDDAFSLIGSGNFDRRSFDLNYELNLVMFGPGMTRRVQTLQEDYLRDTSPASLMEIEARPYSARLTSAAANVLAPLL
jgi:cardiolipin synthase